MSDSSGGHAGYVIWSRFFWSHGLTVSDEGQYLQIANGWETALRAGFKGYGLKVQIEHQPSDPSKDPIVRSFTVE